jgi:hypothetical protein
MVILPDSTAPECRRDTEYPGWHRLTRLVLAHSRIDKPDPKWFRAVDCATCIGIYITGYRLVIALVFDNPAILIPVNEGRKGEKGDNKGRKVFFHFSGF